MRILHTSDWHLGKRLEQFSRLEEQQLVLEEICSIADENNIDVILIAGDLFDTFNPPADAIELFYSTIKKLSKNGTRPVIAIAGNHDSGDRISAPDPLAKQCGIILIGSPDFTTNPFTLESGLFIDASTQGLVKIKLPQYSYFFNILCFSSSRRLV